MSPIISTFYLAGNLPERVRLDGVVTVVDAKHIERHMDEAMESEGDEAIEQIAHADRILLNKTDLVGVRIMRRPACQKENRMPCSGRISDRSRTTHSEYQQNGTVDQINVCGCIGGRGVGNWRV